MVPNVLICDSGISESQIKSVNTIDIGFGWKDENGHGSMISNVIMKVANVACITSIKILDSSKQCTLEDLLVALDYINNMEFHVLCLPVAVEVDKNPELTLAIGKLSKQGKIIISPLANNSHYSIPAGLPKVIGVKADFGEYSADSAFYCSNEPIQAKIPSNMIICESNNENYSFLNGNSLACALFTAHISTLIQKRGILKFDSLEHILFQQKCSDLAYIDYMYQTSPDSVHENSKTLRAKINEICKSMGLVRTETFLNSFSDREHLSTFLVKMREYGLHINQRKFLAIEDLKSLNSLVNYIESNKTEGSSQ